MKSFVKKLICVAICVTCAFTLFSCGEVENGSKIERGVITLSYLNDEGEEVTKKVSFKLYLNFAPDSIEHFKYLASNGYYDNTAISNVGNSYVELGSAYYQNSNDALFKSKYDRDAIKSYSSIITEEYAKNKKTSKYRDDNDNAVNRYSEDFSLFGEFGNNDGATGRTLTDFNGAIVLKRDFGAENYNTAKGTIALTLNSNAYFDRYENYAILGKIVTEDNSLNDLTKLVSDFKLSKDNATYYYYENKDSEFLKENSDANTLRYLMKMENEYYAYNTEEKGYKELDSVTYDDYIKELGENSKYLLTVPYKHITVVSIKIGK